MTRTWKKLATGIYEDARSIQAVVNCAAGRKTRRFPRGTSLLVIRQWRNTTKVRLETLARRRPRRHARGTLRADAKEYLRRVGRTIASWKARRSDVEAWVALYGDRRRHSLTIEDASAAITRWQTEGRVVGTDADGQAIRKPYAAWTIRHRVHALRDLCHALDGADAPTPVDGLKLTKPHGTTPVFVTPATIMAVARKILQLRCEHPGRQTRAKHRRELRKTRARHMVLATTGARPCEVARALPADVNLEQRMWPVRTAKGGIGRVIRLNTPEMIAAWKAFTAAEAWGEYDRSRHAKVLRRAGWPAGVRPYALRGTWGMELSRRGVDLADIKDLLGQADIKTTRVYYVPPEDSRLAAATAATAGRLRWK